MFGSYLFLFIQNNRFEFQPHLTNFKDCDYSKSSKKKLSIKEVIENDFMIQKWDL